MKFFVCCYLQNIKLLSGVILQPVKNLLFFFIPFNGIKKGDPSLRSG